MKRIISTLILCMIFVILPPFVYAEENTQQSDNSQILGELSDNMHSYTDDDVNKTLEENDISLENPESLRNISFGGVVRHVLSLFQNALKSPVIMLGKILAITVLCAAAENMCPQNSQVSGAFKMLGILSVITVTYESIYSSVSLVQNAIDRISGFIISYTPVFSSITAVGGSTAVSASYYAMTLMACDIITVIGNKVIMPFVSIVTAMSVISAVNPRLNFSGAAESVKKACHWILGSGSSLFVGLLSIQGIAGSATDSLASKTAKFAASSFIPIVGGAVSDGYSAIKGSLGIIRSSVGVIGIIIVAIIVLPPMVSIVASKLMISISQTISGLFNQKECTQLLKSINAVLSISLSVMVCLSLVFIISTAVVMIMAMNVAM
ncbi:MAG: hypothetical protein ACI4RC_01190 [Oscillospiraceae bacterium]